MRHRVDPVRSFIARAGGAALLLAAAITCTSAAQTGKHPARRSHPASAAQAAPDVTGTLATPSHLSEAAAPDTLNPYYLPAVSRQRMRACGESWRARKMAGETGDDDWRDFAKACLADNAAKP